MGDILQPTHLLFVLVIALLVLGPKRLPEVGRALGRGLRDFRSALGGDEHEDIPPPSPTETSQQHYQPQPVAEPAPVQESEPVHEPAHVPEAEPVHVPDAEHVDETQPVREHAER